MPELTTSRRGFVQLSATSAAVLAVGASFASLTGCSEHHRLVVLRYYVPPTVSPEFIE